MLDWEVMCPFDHQNIRSLQIIPQYSIKAAEIIRVSSYQSSFTIKMPTCKTATLTDHFAIYQSYSLFLHNLTCVTKSQQYQTSPNHFTYKMNIKNRESHLKTFETLFLINTTEENLKFDSQQLRRSNRFQPNNAESLMMSSLKGSNLKQMKNQQKKSLNLEEQLYPIQTKRRYKFKIHYYFFEVFCAYCLIVSFMYLNRVFFFPLFEVLLVVVITLATQPLNVTNAFIGLGVPISIANYNLNVWILTYPQIVICYFSCYLFTKRKIKNLLWIVIISVTALFGFQIVPAIYRSLASNSKIVLFYLYPWLLLVVNFIKTICTYSLTRSNVLIIQIPLFLTGFSYGMLLVLNVSYIEFWYMIVLLTIQSVNSRFQFLFNIVKRFTSFKDKISRPQSQSNGYLAIQSFHLFILVYIISALNLNSVGLNFDIGRYISDWYTPLVVWLFFVTYQTLSLLKLRNRQNLLIRGFESYTKTQVAKRILGLGLGLWFFYLGLCIPSSFQLA